jgi:hypothetical protein
MRRWIFENKHSALSIQPKMEPLALCDPLPTGQLKRENRAEIDHD